MKKFNFVVVVVLQASQERRWQDVRRCTLLPDFARPHRPDLLARRRRSRPLLGYQVRFFCRISGFSFIHFDIRWSMALTTEVRIPLRMKKLDLQEPCVIFWKLGGSQTWANDHLRIATTCQQWPIFLGPNCGRYTQVWLYLNFKTRNYIFGFNCQKTLKIAKYQINRWLICIHLIFNNLFIFFFRFHTTDGASFPFAWRDDPVKEFNLHPVLMIVGLIYFSGQGTKEIWIQFRESLKKILVAWKAEW